MRVVLTDPSGARLASQVVTRLCASRKVIAPFVLMTLFALPVRADDTTRCKEKCEAQRKKIKQKLKDCLRDVEPRPRDRAAKMRLLCRKRYVAPACDGLPTCKEVEQKKPKPPKPGMKLGAIVFSVERRGSPLARPRFRAGTEVFLRLDVMVTPTPKARRIFLDLSLRLLSVGKKGKTREVVRWDNYSQEQRVITPPERGLVQRFTLHGGAKLTPDQKAGKYLMEATVQDKGSGFKHTTRGSFSVVRRSTK